MPTPLPYVGNHGKIKPLFEKIASAKVPDSFTQKYLSETLGFSGSNDRPLIPLLRALGFIDTAGRPSADYAALKNSLRAGVAVATATKRAFAPLFAANENAHTLTGNELKGLIAQVAGSDDDTTSRVSGTFRALVGLSDAKAFTDDEGAPASAEEDGEPEVEEVKERKGELASKTKEQGPISFGGAIRSEFHYNIQVHLPSNGSEETYLNIFNALRKALS